MDIAVVSTTCVQLNSLVRVPLPIRVIALERTLGAVSRVLTLVVYILEGIRTRSAICGCLPRRVGLGVGFAAPSHRPMVLHSVWSTTLLTLSILIMIYVGQMSPAPTVATLGNSRVHSSPPDCGCIMSKVK